MPFVLHVFVRLPVSQDKSFLAVVVVLPRPVFLSPGGLSRDEKQQKDVVLPMRGW